MKKCLYLLLILLLLPLAVHADDSGPCGNNVSYVYKGATGTLTISGTGAMQNYSYDYSAPWSSFCEKIKKVVLNEGVTSIGGYAFRDCSGLTFIEIPNSVTSIGEDAFSGCSGLTSIEIPNSVTSIGNYAFSGCSGLTSIEIPNSVTSIGEWAFLSCSGLTSIEIPNSLTSIGSYAFSGCSGLTSINVESGNTKYDSRDNCNAIIENSSNTLIAGCKNTIIPNSVTSIGDGALFGCSGLTYIWIPNSVTSIGGSAFIGCHGLTSIEIPNSVTSIGSNAFWGCSGLTSIVIPNSVTSFGKAAFASCGGLTSVTCLAESVPTIPSNAFNDSPISSATLSVPAGSKAAYEAAYIWKDFKKIIGINDYGSCGNNVSYVYEEATGTLTISGAGAMTDHPWSSYMRNIKKVVLNDGVTSIGNYAFYYCSGLTSIVIPNSVTSIGNSAFNGCSSLTSIEIPNSVTSIGDYAFEGCSGLTSINVESGNTKYDSRDNCNAIIETSSNTLVAGCKNTIIPNSVTSIGEDAFFGCSGLTSIVIPNSVTSIGNYAFQCSGLTSIVIPNSVTSIGNYAFQFCSGLTSIVIPNSVTSIGFQPFSYCSGLTSINVESGNTKYDSRDNCNAIIETSSNTLVAGCKNTIIPNSVTSIGEDAFSSCSGLTSIEIPNSVTSIGNEAFYGCSGLTSIVIPNSVTSIGRYVFANCSSLTSIVIPNSVTSIGEYAFSNCSSLTSVTCQAESVPTTDYYAFYNSPISSATLYVPVGSKAAYEVADVWKDFKEIVEIEAATASIYFFDDALLETNAAGLSQLTYADGATIVLNMSNKYFSKGKSTTVGDKSYIAIKLSTGAENIFTAPDGKTVTGVKFYSYINSADEERTNFWSQVGDKTYTATSEDVQIMNSRDASDPDVTTYSIAPASSFTFRNSGYQLCFVMEVTYGDALISVQDAKAYIGKTASVDIDLTNSTEDLTAYQFDLTLPEGFSLSQNDKGKFLATKTSRYEDDSQTLNISKLEGNTYRFVCFSMSNEVITGTSGAILNASLTIGESVSEGSYEATISNIVVTKTNGTQLKLSDAKFNIVVTNVIKGDANGDGEVNVSDIVEIVNYIMNKPSDKFVFAAADVNEDGEINVTDIVKVVSIIMSANSSQAKMSAAQTEMTDNDQVQLVDNEDQTISLMLNNEGGYVASQFDLVLSDNQSLESITLNNNRTDNHILTYTKTGENRYRVLSYSLNNATYDGHSGELLDIKVAGNGDVSVEDILFVTAEETEKRFSPLHSGTTGISVTTKQAEAMDIYSVDGRLVHEQAKSMDGLERGIYIINGKKHIVR